jgi:hypothetical protein
LIILNFGFVNAVSKLLVSLESLVSLLAYKRKERYVDVISYIRTKVQFALLKSALISIRGIRGKGKRKSIPISEVSFGLVPSEKHYESR